MEKPSPLEERAAKCRRNNAYLKREIKGRHYCFHDAYEDEESICQFQGGIIGGKYECYFGKKYRICNARMQPRTKTKYHWD